MALREIKGKIRAVSKTRKVTRAMEAVSAVKMRKSQATAISGRPYAITALSILSKISKVRDAATHPLLQKRPLQNLLLIVVTSDKGLAGTFNASVLRKATEVIAQSKLSTENISILALGKKAAEYFASRGFNVVKRHENISDDVKLDDLATIAEKANGYFAEGKADKVVAVYTNFITTLTQIAIARDLLPLDTEALQKLVSEITPPSGRYADLKASNALPVASYTFEPGEEEVLNALFPRLFNVALYHALLESKASEHSARMVAMKNATEKAGELESDLTREFNKTRQAQITREVSEITSGIEVMG